MLTISPSTRVAFERVEEDKYIARLSQFLKEKVPAMAAVPPAELHGQLRLLIAQARTFDMVTEAGIAAYSVTAAMLGLDFVERFRGARVILMSSETEERKARLLEGFTVRLLETLGRPL